MKPGDRVVSELDGNEYTVIRFGSRDELDPLPGVIQAGNAVVVEDSSGKKQLLFEWEIALI